MNYLKFLFLLLAGTLLFSCNPDDEMPPEPPNEEELITTVEFTLASDSGDVVLRFEDLDGEGGNDATITGGVLKAGVEYTGSIVLLNEAESPVEDITVEVMEEAEEHQFFYSNDLAMVIAYDDVDADNNPIGLKTKISDLNPGTGTIKVTLIHEPVKSASGVSDGDISNAEGETDIEVNFPITIE